MVEILDLTCNETYTGDDTEIVICGDSRLL
jgi:hypothetical protein